MIINNNSSQTYQYSKNNRIHISTKNNNYSTVSFGNKQSNSNSNVLRKVRNISLAGLLTIAGLNTCSDRVSNGVDNIDGIKVEYFNVKPELKDSVIAPVLNLKSQLGDEENFLDGVQIDITKRFSNLDDENSFREFVKGERTASSVKGISFYSDSKLPRRIIIQENAHLSDKAKNYSNGGRYSAIPALKQTIMHEVGHHFDNYYSHDHNAKFAQEWDSLLFVKETSPESNPYEFDCTNMKDKRISVAYTWNSGLSDNKSFQKAFLKDINAFKYLKKEDLPENIEYYVKNFNINGTITDREVDYAEHQRSEVYANLFSYAFGENDGEKEKFIRCFSNSYEIVKSDISKFLKIKL